MVRATLAIHQCRDQPPCLPRTDACRFPHNTTQPFLVEQKEYQEKIHMFQHSTSAVSECDLWVSCMNARVRCHK